MIYETFKSNTIFLVMLYMNWIFQSFIAATWFASGKVRYCGEKSFNISKELCDNSIQNIYRINYKDAQTEMCVTNHSLILRLADDRNHEAHKHTRNSFVIRTMQWIYKTSISKVEGREKKKSPWYLANKSIDFLYKVTPCRTPAMRGTTHTLLYHANIVTIVAGFVKFCHCDVGDDR